MAFSTSPSRSILVSMPSALDFVQSKDVFYRIYSAGYSGLGKKIVRSRISPLTKPRICSINRSAQGLGGGWSSLTLLVLAIGAVYRSALGDYGFHQGGTAFATRFTTSAIHLQSVEVGALGSIWFPIVGKSRTAVLNAFEQDFFHGL